MARDGGMKTGTKKTTEGRGAKEEWREEQKTKRVAQSKRERQSERERESDSR